MLKAFLSKKEAEEILSYIKRHQKDIRYAVNSKFAITSQRATFLYNERTHLGGLYSNYAKEEVIKEIPKKYKKKFLRID